MPSGVGTGDKCIANLKANILQPRIGLGQQSDQKPRNKSGQPTWSATTAQNVTWPAIHRCYAQIGAVRFKTILLFTIY